jgi:O-antigen/teichoic acid export membrane protein
VASAERSGTLETPEAAPDAATPSTGAGNGPVDGPGGLAGLPETDDRGAVGDAALMTSATYVSQALLFVAGLIQKGLLGPVGAGFWALMQSFWELFSILTLGASAGTGRQIPLRRGREDFAGAAEAARTGISFGIAAMAVGGLAISLVALVFGGGWDTEIQIGLIVLGLMAPLRMLENAHMLVYSATRRFRAVAFGTVLKGVVALTVQTVAVVAFGFWGMFVGVGVTSILALAMWRRMGLTGLRRPAFTVGVDRQMLRELISYGAPMLVWGQLWLLFMGIDNLLVAAWISVEDLGYYALAVSVTTYVLHMPRSIGATLAPRMAEDYGRSGELADLRGYAVNVQRLLSYLLVPLFIAAVFFGLPVLIHHALPEFIPAIPVVHVMAAGSFFISLTNMPVKAMITAGRRKPLILLLLPCLAVNVGGNYLAIQVLEEGIIGAAVATSLSYLIVFFVTGTYGLSGIIGRRETVGHLVEMALGAAYAIAVLWGVEQLIGPGEGSLLHETAIALLKFALAIVAMLPLLIRSQRLDRGPARLLEMFRVGLKRVRGRIGRA